MRRVLLTTSLIALANASSAAPCSVDRDVRKIVAEEYGKSASQVSPQDKFAVDGPHTIEDVEIKQMTEEKFHVKISDKAWSRFVVVKDISDYLRTNLPGCK